MNNKTGGFGSMFTQVVEKQIGTKQEQVRIIDEKQEELSSKEETQEIKLAIEQNEGIKKEVEIDIKELEEDKKTSLEETIEKTQEINLMIEPYGLKTAQYQITHETMDAVNVAYMRLKKYSPNLKKGGIVELAIREFLDLDTKWIKDKIGIESKEG